MRPRVPRCVGSLAAFACLAACGGPPKGGGPAIESVTFSGNRAVDDGELAEGLAIHEPAWYSFKEVGFDRRDIDDDKERIQRQYRQRGYFNVSVTEVVTGSSAQGEGEGKGKVVQPGKVSVEFVIDEGEPVRVTEVRFDGAPDEPDVNADALAKVAGIRKGRPFDHPAYLAAKETLFAHLVSRGFAHAEVRGQVRVQPSEYRAVVEFAIDAGPRVRFGPLKVEGLDTTPRSAVENRLAWEEGDPYRPDLPATTRARLRTLGFYSTVRVAVEDEGRKAQPPVEVAVIEAPRNTVRLGGGFAIDSVQMGVRGLAGYSRLTALGPLTTFKSEFRPGYVWLRPQTGTDTDPSEDMGGGNSALNSGIVYEARMSVEKDDFLFPLLNGLVGVDYSVRRVETYRSEGPTLRTKLSRTFADGFIYVGLGYQLQRLCLTEINDQISDDTRVDLGFEIGGGSECLLRSREDVTTYDLGVLEQDIAIDGRDDAVKPRLGYYAGLKLQEASVSLGSEFSFVTGVGELRGFVPLGDRVVLAALARWSQLLAGDRLPITRRYFGGGATSHRGFGQRRLTPLAIPDQEDSVGIGGEAMFEGGLEARFDVAKVAGQTLGLVAFVDVGDVTKKAGELDPFNVHVAAGGGLRLYTPIGPVRFDVGYRLNRYGPGEPDYEGTDSKWTDRLALHFTLGEAF